MLLELFDKGGPVMWPLLGASVLGLALILDRLVAFAWWSQNFDRVVGALKPLVLRGAWKDAEAYCARRGPYTLVARTYLQQREQPRKVREDVLGREGSLLLGHLETRLRALAVLAQLSTLLGLLGTFEVLIRTFQNAEGAGGQFQPTEFTAAIWAALLTTMYGLLIAIPCSAAYHLFEGRVDRISARLRILVSYLDEWRRIHDAERAVEGNGAPAARTTTLTS